jgi:two-component system, OmpR family, phosphate regulon sensor histidine kinase PhoR
MKSRKLRISLAMMMLSTMLLVLLQLWWLRTEYRSAKGAFERETDLVFKSTIKQVSDSAMFRQMRKFMYLREADSSKLAHIRIQRASANAREAHKEITIESLSIESTNDPTQANKKVEQRIHFGTGGQDTLFMIRAGNGPHQNSRFIFDMGLDEVDSDSLKNLFITNLNSPLAELQIKIISKEGGLPILHIENDSLAYTTDYYRLGIDTLYAAQFIDASGYILKSMLPQIGFSVILTALVIGSFGLVFYHLKAQEKLIAQKNEFIANVTHELKTPVATVGVALEAIKDFDVLKNPEKAREYLQMATHELARLSLLTDRILKTSIFDLNEEIRLHKEAVSLKNCVEEALQSLRALLEKAEISIVFSTNTDGQLQGNKEHLTQMIYNVLENAIKYGGEHGRIVIDLQQAGQTLSLSVQDAGPGIPADQLKKVFEKFYRVPTHDVHNVKGYGLGLSYVKQVVECHGGAVRLTTHHEGGLIVKIQLPNLRD